MNIQNLRDNTPHAESANEEIAALAYSFFEAAGRLDGHDLEHWLRARDQLAKERSSGIEMQKNAKAADSRMNNGSAEKTPGSRASRGRGKDSHAQASTGR